MAGHNGFLVLNEKDWEKMDQQQRDWAVFNTLQSMNGRLKVLERKTFIDKVYSTIGGIIGGGATAIGINMNR